MNQRNKRFRIQPCSTAFRITLKQSGAVLITSLLVLITLTLLSTTALKMTGFQEKMTNNQKLIARAEFAAERGVSNAISDLVSETIKDTDPGETPTDPSWSETIVPKTDWSPAFAAASKGYDFNYTISHRTVNGVVALSPDDKPYYQIASNGTSDNAGISLDVVVSLAYASYFETGLVGCYGVDFLSNSVSDSYSSSGQPTNGDKGGISTISYIDADGDGVPDSGIFDGSIALNSGAIINGPLRATNELDMESGATVLRDAYANGNITGKSTSSIGQDAYSNGTINAPVAGTPHPNQVNQVVELEPCDPIGLPDVFLTGIHKDAQTQIIRYLPTLANNDNAEIATQPGMSGLYEYEVHSHLAAASIFGVHGQSKDYYLNKFDIDVPSGSTPYQAEIRGDVVMFIDGDFSLKSTAKVELAANSSLVIYITGKFLMEANTELNNGGFTKNLQIYSTAVNSTNAITGPGSEDPMVEIMSNSGFSGAVYAPFAHVLTNSNSEIYGAIRGKWVTMEQNAGFHYDEDLQNLGGGVPKGYDKIYWGQQSFTASGTP